VCAHYPKLLTNELECDRMGITMNIQDFFKKIKNRWEAVLITVIVSATFGLYINFFLPHYYRASSEYLIIQKQNPNIDAYTAIKGAEQLAYTFKQIIHSSAFWERISKSNFNINTAYFGKSQEKIIKKWQRTAIVETVPNTGILKVDIFHPDQKEAYNIDQAVTQIIKNDRDLFLGSNQEIETIILGDAIVSNKFVKPHALVNTFLGLIFGFIASAGFAFVFPEKGAKKTVLKNIVKSEENIKRINNDSYGESTKKASAPSNLPIV
jgi:capsular polysaccharide biosynthesis protein